MSNRTLTKLALITEHARRDATLQFTSLAHLLDAEFLRGCYLALGKEKASGIDGVSWHEWGEHLDENLSDLVSRLKSKKYKPRPARRVYIPKGDGKSRPLGLPALEDKIVQKGIARILEAIYEVDFMDFSYGFRPQRSCHQALKAVNDTIMFGRVNYVIEADIQGFFDNVSHEWMMQFLEVRIKDPSLLLLVRRFLKAGYMEAGQQVRTQQGTPQGGNLSPMLANIFLHYVLDLWFERRVKPNVAGECHLVRYADDFVCMVQSRATAVEIERLLRERFAKFGLTLHPDKTRSMSFGRYEREKSRRQGRRANTFDFLGFTHFCGMSRKGGFLPVRKTSGKKFAKACKDMNGWLRQVRSQRRIEDWWPTLAAKLRGHYQYYGVSGNYRMIARFADRVMKLLYKWLNRRSQKRSFNWVQFRQYLARHPLPRPYIVHSLYTPTVLT